MHCSASHLSRVTCPGERADACLALQAALDAEGIKPSVDPIPTADVIAAISKHFGVDPILHCSRGGGRTFLNEVSMLGIQACAAWAVLYYLPHLPRASKAVLPCVSCTPWFKVSSAGAQVFLPVTRDFRVVDSDTTCRVHPCVPSDTLDKELFCEDELIYKVPYDIDPEEPEECDDDKNLCKPKSGTCKASRHGHGSQQDMLLTSDAF